MDRSHPFHLTARTVILILHVVAFLFLRTPESRSSDKAPLLATMSDTSASWIQSQLTRLYEATDLDDVFTRVFSPACEVRLNHAPQPLQMLRDDLAAHRAAAMHIGVAWNADVISTSDNPGQPVVVAGAFVVARSLPFRIRVGPAQRLTHVHFSARFERDTSVKGEDQRRVTSFYYTSVDKTPPIHLAVPRASQGQ